MDWAALYNGRMGDTPCAPVGTRVHMPRPPRAVAELARLSEGSQVSPADLTRIVETDTELTARVLKLVNSCAHGLAVKIHSVRRAVDLLGARRVKMLVMSAAVQASMDTASSDLIDHNTFLGECLERACFARYTAEVLGVDADCAYVGGLLQDLLLPCLMAGHPEEYKTYSPDEGPLTAFERRTFGWDHAAVTAQLLKSWSFPDEVVCCVLCHHDAGTLLADPQLRQSPLAATAVGALLPDALHQEPHGISRLLEYQTAAAEFNFLEVAVRVDDQVEQGGRAGGQRTALCDRLGRLAMAHLEQRRMDDNWTERTIGNYTLEEEIGQGAMGVVYRARHSSLRRPAAVKLMKTAHLDPLAIERFEVEAQLTSGLSNPHTIRIYDYGTTRQGVFYYVMEHLKGLSLCDLVECYGPQREARVIHILRHVCASLAEAHSAGLIHRDIKAENIFLTVHGGSYDFAKVLDFGLARMVERTDTPSASSRMVCGTPAYLAPEAILHPESADARTDLYSLGVVAYYLVTGQLPFVDGDARAVLQAHVEREPMTPSERLGRPVSADLEGIILQCLAKDPDRRPDSALHLDESLRQCAAVGGWTPEAALGWWLLHVNSQPIERPSNYMSTVIRKSFLQSRRRVLQAATADA
jgi:serine/threonine protein kinase/HD-like signal output (HDOD) protein